ncbi:hypothetical protein A9Q84_13750 [Halobacteriovorax marinus]|uniref:Uncharacterized protein n=1 Tax=Halobacteriovorax marinus TaxID=97084 RepID=A0A1Y5F9B2_9BACT|nr:hypothetical protein A9Q84_13750 [Halobacteriovorax marinus]
MKTLIIIFSACITFHSSANGELNSSESLKFDNAVNKLKQLAAVNFSDDINSSISSSSECTLNIYSDKGSKFYGAVSDINPNQILKMKAGPNYIAMMLDSNIVFDIHRGREDKTNRLVLWLENRNAVTQVKRLLQTTQYLCR